MVTNAKRKRCPKCRRQLVRREEYAGSMRLVKWCMWCGWISEAMLPSEMRQEMPND